MTPKGTIVAIGGAEDKGGNESPDMKSKGGKFMQFEILKGLMPQKTQRNKHVAIITTASSVPGEMDEMYKTAFRKIGFRKIDFIKIESKQEARDPRWTKMIENCHTVLFTGGDQFVLSALLGGTSIVKTIKDKYVSDKNFIVAGTSAGAMALPKIMIFEGGTSEALLKEDIKMCSGLGFFDTCIIDTHFIKRGRFSRLTNAVIMNPETLGIGLGEDTAMIIRKGTIAELSGSGSVTIIDGREISYTNITEVDDKTPVLVENLKVHLMAKGCCFDLQQRKMIIGKRRRIPK